MDYSDMMLKTTESRYRCPDVMVSCDSGDENAQFLAGAVLLIEQDFVEVEVLRRSTGWQPSYYYLGDEVWLESVDLHKCNSIRRKKLNM